jgi:hypothetical protein
MIEMKAFQEMALSFPNTEQVPHFERIGFKIIGRRMFATYLEKDNTANIFLSPAEQKLFCKIDKKSISPVPNKGEKRGRLHLPLIRSVRNWSWKLCFPHTMKSLNRRVKSTIKSTC